MKKILLTGIVLSVLSFGCEQKCPTVPKYFDITDVRLHYAFKGEESYWDEFTANPDSVKFESFRLGVDFGRRYYSVNTPKGFSLVPAAYALSCVDPIESVTKEKITDLQLIALSDYKANYLTGASLNPIIKINGLSVATYIENRNEFGLTAFDLQFDFSEKPDSTVKQTFKLIFKLDTGETYEAQTVPATIY